MGATSFERCSSTHRRFYRVLKSQKSACRKKSYARLRYLDKKVAKTASSVGRFWAPRHDCFENRPNGPLSPDGLEKHKNSLRIMCFGGWRTLTIYSFGDEMGRRGSKWADTLGKRRHEPQHHFKMPPGPPGYYKKIIKIHKTLKMTENRNCNIFPYMYTPDIPHRGRYVIEDLIICPASYITCVLAAIRWLPQPVFQGLADRHDFGRSDPTMARPKALPVGPLTYLI